MSELSQVRPRVAVLATGGTISMTSGPNGIVPRLDAADLVRSVGGESALPEVSTRSLRSVPSAHLAARDLADLARAVDVAVADGADGVVITHGTDTLEETAYFLDLVLSTRRPVVITGALRGADQLGADGPANLAAAIRVAADPQSAARGVLAVLNDEVHLARRVTKRHTTRMDAFASPGAGPVGVLTEERVRWLWPVQPREAAPTWFARPSGVVPSVLLLSTWLGDDGALLRAALATGPAGMVIEGLGAGHVPPALVEPLGEAAGRMPVVLTTSVGAGEVHRRTYDYVGSESDLLGRGLLWGGALSGRKARILVAVALEQGWPRARLEEALADDPHVGGGVRPLA